MPSNITKNLQQYYRIGVKKDNSGKTVITPLEYNPIKNTLGPLKYPDPIQKLYDWWMNSCTDTNADRSERFLRYEDLDQMYTDQTLCTRALDMYADETTQADSQNKTIGVEAKTTTLERKINGLIDQWGFTQDRLREIAHNLAGYGDSFTINSTLENYGITDVTFIDPRSIKRRVEFSASDVQREYMKDNFLTKLYSQNDKLGQLAKALKNNTDYSKFFKTHLFGFQITDTDYLPPWAVSHFRLFTTQKEFYPYGRPVFMNLISTFRQLKAMETMQGMAKAANFPKEQFTIKTDENMTALDKWGAVDSAREEYLNLNQTVSDKEKFGLGGQIWLSDNVMDYELVSPNMRLSDITDINYYHEQIAIGTGIPINFLIADKGSFGTSGVSLIQQYKPFGRAILRIQNAILQELTTMIKTHFILAGEKNVDDLEFNLFMNFPAIEETRDRTSAKSDSIRLARDIIDNLTQSVGLDRGESLPIEIVRDIFAKYTFLPAEDINEWIKIYQKEQAQETQQISEKGKKKIRERLNEKVIKEVYFQALRENNHVSGVVGNRHFINSNYKCANSGMIEDLLLINSIDKRLQG